MCAFSGEAGVTNRKMHARSCGCMLVFVVFVAPILVQGRVIDPIFHVWEEKRGVFVFVPVMKAGGAREGV